MRRPAEQGASFSEPGGWIGRGGYREAGSQSGARQLEGRMGGIGMVDRVVGRGLVCGNKKTSSFLRKRWLL
jgi:hypothetical protein